MLNTLIICIIYIVGKTGCYTTEGKKLPKGQNSEGTFLPKGQNFEGTFPKGQKKEGEEKKSSSTQAK